MTINSNALETGLLDFYKIIVMAMKSTIHKLKPIVVHQRNYKKFSNDQFRKSLPLNLSFKSLNVRSNGLKKIFIKSRIKTDLHKNTS